MVFSLFYRRIGLFVLAFSFLCRGSEVANNGEIHSLSSAMDLVLAEKQLHDFHRDSRRPNDTRVVLALAQRFQDRKSATVFRDLARDNIVNEVLYFCSRIDQMHPDCMTFPLHLAVQCCSVEGVRSFLSQCGPDGPAFLDLEAEAARWVPCEKAKGGFKLVGSTPLMKALEMRVDPECRTKKPLRTITQLLMAAGARWRGDHEDRFNKEEFDRMRKKCTRYRKIIHEERGPTITKFPLVVDGAATLNNLS